VLKKWTHKSPWILLKIFLLGALNSFTLWAVPILISNGSYVFAGYFIFATVVIDYVFLSKKRVAGKYIIPGVLLLIAFTIYPALFTGYIAFTNYSTGHILNKETAIEVLISNSYQSAADNSAYPARVATDNLTGEYVFLVQPPNGDVTLSRKDGFSNLPRSDISLAEDGSIASAAGFKLLTEDEIFEAGEALTDLSLNAGKDEYFKLVDTGLVERLVKTLEYDAQKDLITNTQTGVVYRPNDRGSMVSDEGEELEPGWQSTVGLYNFQRVIEDERYRAPMIQVLTWTFIFAFLVVLTTFFAGLLLALTFNHPKLKAKKIYRSLIIVPYAMPGVLSMLTWRGMYNEDNGIINRIIGSELPWLSDPTLAKAAVLITQLWAGTPYMFLICTGAIQALSSEVLEAAQVDGASPSKIFWKIKLPLVLYSLTPLLIASYAYNFSNFNAIYLLTGGGPQIIESGGIAGHTDILISYTYRLAFTAGKGNDYGLASAVSFLNFAIIAIISVYGFRKSRSVENM
jgi:arabinogalactan oligomer/maltooligosaccharide transport system permease protein